MKTEDLKDNKPVQHVRDTSKEEYILEPASEKEVKSAVKEINPDKNSMNSRG